MVIEQYPHYLYRQRESEPVMQSNGDWIATQTQLVYVGRCREETNGKGQTIKTTDFESFVFSSLVQCPKGTEAIAEGTTNVVTDKPIELEDYNVRIKGVCAKFDISTLHCRLWL